MISRGPSTLWATLPYLAHDVDLRRSNVLKVHRVCVICLLLTLNHTGFEFTGTVVLYFHYLKLWTRSSRVVVFRYSPYCTVPRTRTWQNHDPRLPITTGKGMGSAFKAVQVPSTKCKTQAPFWHGGKKSLLWRRIRVKLRRNSFNNSYFLFFKNTHDLSKAIGLHKRYNNIYKASHVNLPQMEQYTIL